MKIMLPQNKFEFEVGQSKIEIQAYPFNNRDAIHLYFDKNIRVESHGDGHIVLIKEK